METGKMKDAREALPSEFDKETFIACLKELGRPEYIVGTYAQGRTAAKLWGSEEYVVKRRHWHIYATPHGSVAVPTERVSDA